MSTETKVAGHYTRGHLEERILQAVKLTGKDTQQLTAGDFAVMDEFHVGGMEATQELATQMELRPGLKLLDIGSGVGGPARYFAGEHGCHVAGIDLTAEFVQVARSLTRLVKLDHLAEFREASALDLPFEGGTFDGAYMLHVGMNIADKAGLFREARRVMKPGGLFTLYDIMQRANGPMQYPVPWAVEPGTSFVTGVDDYRKALQGAGFRVERERGRGAFAVEFIQRMTQRMTQNGPQVLGLQLLTGEQTQSMFGNLLAMMQAGLLEPTEVFARAV